MQHTEAFLVTYIKHWPVNKPKHSDRPLVAGCSIDLIVNIGKPKELFLLGDSGWLGGGWTWPGPGGSEFSWDVVIHRHDSLQDLNVLDL